MVSSKRQWSRLAYAMALCLASQPSCGSSPSRKRLGQNPRTRQLPQSRIVNGRNAHGSKDYPFFGQWYRGCGASLIHPDVLLTAAHCNSDTALTHAVRIEGDATRVFREAVQSRVHPQFNQMTNIIKNNQYDFMLLKLEAPVPNVRPVPVFNELLDRPLQDEENLTIVGYGLLREDGPAATTLQEGTVQYHKDCSFANYMPDKLAYETMFCAHGRYNDTTSVDTCQGDSGGPILRKTPQGWVQVGVTSWGQGCAHPEAPGVYSRLAAAYDWIQSQLCELSSLPPPHCSGLQVINSAMTADAAGEKEEGFTPEELSSPQLDATQAVEANKTVVDTLISLRVDIQYDNFPQEISWALAKHQPESLTTETLVYVSRRQPVTVRNQLISQQILNVKAGSSYKLEFYDSVAGDGLGVSGNRDAIEVYQVQTTVEATLKWDGKTNTTVPVHVTELDARSHLLWYHRGDFGEYIQAKLDVQTI